MPKIRITCNDPCATDSSSDDDELIDKEKPQTGGVFLEEILVSVPLVIPTTISTVHIDSLARLKSDSSFRVDESESSEDGPNCIVLALSAIKPEAIPGKKSGISSICKSLKKSSMAQKGEVDATSISSEEDGSIEASPTSVNVAEKSRIQRASGHPGVYKKYGKWVVRVRDPIRKSRMWVGTYNTLEEALDIHDKKKLEYAPLGSEMFMEDASFRVDESNSYLAEEPKDTGTKNSAYPGNLPVQNMVMQDALSRLDESESSVGERRCIVLGLSARQPEDTRRKKSAVINGFEKLSIAVDIPIAKNPSKGTEKHPGLKLQSTGKWGVQIRDPIKKSRIWLGTYRTIEEAKDVYAKKKLEFESMTPAVFKHKKTPLPKAKCKQKNFRLGSHDTPDEAVKSYNRKPEFDSSYNCHGVGKSSSIVHDPRDTPEEAVKSYNRVMLEFDSSYNCDSVVKSSSILIEEALKLTETEKWRVAIRHPMLQHSFSLGLYETPEEAAEVYSKKQLELDALLQSDDKTTTKQPIQDLSVNKYKGVSPSGTGRWMARIQRPFTSKKRVYLGTFNTAEEAAEACNRTRREFNAIVSLFSKRKHEGASEAHEKKMKKKQKAEFLSKKAIILDEALIAHDQRTSHFEIVVLPHSYSHQQHRVDDAYAPIQTETSNNSHETDTGVVDSFGQLVGEYSSLDDELWLSRPGDDDEFDANVAVGSDTGEFGWDHNLKPSFL